jgi:hypothetical protein
VETVANLGFFQFAQIGVEFGEVSVFVACESGIFGKAVDLGERQDFPA